MIELLPLAITACAVLATLFLAKKNGMGWIYYALANVGTIIYGSLQNPYAWGLVAQGFVYMGLCFYGIRQWTKSEGPDKGK